MIIDARAEISKSVETEQDSRNFQAVPMPYPVPGDAEENGRRIFPP